ncbi:MAG: metal-dependent hydrolase [Moraxellaceae bacterium]|nr:metal-dependent hydrolase [Moraxellaceae bacterium]
MNESNVRQFMSSEARKSNGASVGIPARLMDFPLPEGRPKFPFFGGNPLASSLFAVFSGIFPPGERFFVESVRRFRDQIEDETLKAEVSGFIGQEAIHGREHEHLNEWFTAQGYDMAMPDRMIRFSLGLLEKLSPTQQIACTNFMEHFTAHLAEQWLVHEEFRSSTDPEVIKLWTWHAIEELEHKAVAFDVHAKVSKHAYLERVLAAPLVLTALIPGVAFSLFWITARQGEALNLREHRRGLKSLLGQGGFIRKVLERVPEYFDRSFHPEQQETRLLEQQWRDRLFGENGELNVHFRNRDAVKKSLGPRRDAAVH